jgi:TRAP-type C4-dicarboxylate transport system permease small subunit
MICLKSVLVGLVALLVSAVVVVFVAFIGLGVWEWARGGWAHGGSSIDFTLGFSGRSPVDWTLPILIFFAAFYWEYRRLSR